MTKKLIIITILMFVTTLSVFSQNRMLSFVSFVQEKEYSDPEGLVLWFRGNPYNKSFGVDEEVYLFHRGISRYMAYTRFQGSRRELEGAGVDFQRVLKYPQESQYFYKDRAFLMIAGIMMLDRTDKELPARMLEYFLYVSEPSHPFYITALYWSCYLGYLERSVYQTYYEVLSQLSNVRGSLIYDFNTAQYTEVSKLMKKLKVPKKAVLYNYKWTRNNTDLFILIEQVISSPNNNANGKNSKSSATPIKESTKTPIRETELLGNTTVRDGIPITEPNRMIVTSSTPIRKLTKLTNASKLDFTSPNITITDNIPLDNTETDDNYMSDTTIIYQGVSTDKDESINTNPRVSFTGNLKEDMVISSFLNSPSATDWFDRNKYSSIIGVSPYEYAYYRGVAYFGRFINEGRTSTVFAAQAFNDFNYSMLDKNNTDLLVNAGGYLAAIEIFAYGNVENSDRYFKNAISNTEINSSNYPTIIYWRLRLHLSSRSESDNYRQYLQSISQSTKIADYTLNKYEPLSTMLTKASSEGITIKPVKRVSPILSNPM